MTNFNMKIRIMVQRRKLNDLRVALGRMRQRQSQYNGGQYDGLVNNKAVAMQLKIGEIEETLARCERLV